MSSPRIERIREIAIWIALAASIAVVANVIVTFWLLKRGDWGVIAISANLLVLLVKVFCADALVFLITAVLSRKG